jgi:hypothetical protein
MASRSNARMPRGARSLLDRFNLRACYRVKDGGSSWITRCRHCSAGWLLSKDTRDVDELIEHAAKHRIAILRMPCVPRPIQRRIVIRVGGRLIGAVTQHVSVARAEVDHCRAVTVEVCYESSGSTHGVSPFKVCPPPSARVHREFHAH